MNFDLIPEQASTFAEKVDPMFYFLCLLTFVGTNLVFFLVVALAWKFRWQDDGRPSSHLESPMLEVIWVVGPTILFLAIFAWGMVLFFDYQKVPDGALEIDVVGKQWMWKIQHPDGVREVNTLHVPVDQPIVLNMTSQDVLHDFYVPAFRVKMDVLPGRNTKLWFEATKTGTYHLFCAEYCGTEHSLMGGQVVVLEPEEYIQWLEGGPKMSPVESGEFLFTQRGCASCHEGTTPRGPSLAGIFGSTVRFTTGTEAVVDDEYLIESILESNKRIVEGYTPLMPSFKNQLSTGEVNDLIAYIKSLSAEEQTD